MKVRCLAVLVLVAASTGQAAAAACPPHTFTLPSQVNLGGDGSQGEHWSRVSLLETMGVIVREEHELEYLRRALPHWERTFPVSLRVEMQINDSSRKLLSHGEGRGASTLLFRFVDSAVNLAAPPFHVH